MARLGRRDRIITAILDATGFRLDDVMRARVWELRTQTIKLREAKTGKVRSVTISPGLHSRLSAYFAGRPPLRAAFPTLCRRRRHREHRSTFWRHFVAAAAAAGLPRSYTPHGLRKRYAVRLFRQTGDLEAVRRDLGHAYIGTTAIYALSADLYSDKP